MGPCSPRSTDISPSSATAACRFDFELDLPQQLERQGDHDADGQARRRRQNGASVEVYWYYDKEDDTMQELGEEFGEDLQNAKFHLEKMAG